VHRLGAADVSINLEIGVDFSNPTGPKYTLGGSVSPYLFLDFPAKLLVVELHPARKSRASANFERCSKRTIASSVWKLLRAAPEQSYRDLHSGRCILHAHLGTDKANACDREVLTAVFLWVSFGCSV
jgi:hypothetical protein